MEQQKDGLQAIAEKIRARKPLPDDALCPRCGNLLPDYPTTDAILADRGLTRAMAYRGMCNCDAADRLKLTVDQARWQDADLPRGPVAKTFETYNVYVDGLKTALAATQALVEGTPPNIVLLTGDSGTGKTHLLEAVGRAVLAAGKTAKYAFVPDLLEHLRSTYSPRSEEDVWFIMRDHKMVDTLLLDDLGQGNITPWVQEKIMELVDERYRNGRRLLVSTNLTVVQLEERMGERLASRLYDTTSGSVLVAHLGGCVMLRELSLFSGYGGFSLGLKLAGLEVRTVGYVEIESYCQEIIKARIKDGYLDDAPIFPDIRSFDGEQCRGVVDIITGGFPCQPHSFAGQRRGESDERNLWPDTLRVISEVGPSFVLLENVPGLGAANRVNLRILEARRQLRLSDESNQEPDSGGINRSDVSARGYAYMGTVVGQLSALGYDCRAGLVPAASIGAPHLRWRWWCLAYASDNGRTGWGRATQQERQHDPMGRSEQPGSNGEAGTMADTEGQRTHGQKHARESDVERRGEALAESQGTGWEEWRGTIRAPETFARPQLDGEDIPYANQQPRQERNQREKDRDPTSLGDDAARYRLQSWWTVEPDVGRVAHGIASRVDRLRALGNGIVPEVVAEFLRSIG